MTLPQMPRFHLKHEQLKINTPIVMSPEKSHLDDTQDKGSRRDEQINAKSKTAKIQLDEITKTTQDMKTEFSGEIQSLKKRQMK